MSKKTVNSSSQKFIPIKDIRDGVVILNDNKMCMVLLASSINFALKSLDEQEAILHQFQAFLNTIDFSLQFYVQSRKLDIRPYIELLQSRESHQDNDLMKIQLREYIDFIQSFTTEVDIMKKSFFVVISYNPGAADVKSGLKSLVGKQSSDEKFDPERFAEYRTQLEQRVAVVEQGLNRIGVRTIPLGHDELIELYYHIFNPLDINPAPKPQ